MTDSVDELWSHAQNHIAAKQAAPARAALESLLESDPEHVLARLALCDVLLRQDHVREATRHALEAARAHPPWPELICEIVATLLRVGEIVAARTCLRHPALAHVNLDTVLMRLADQWHNLGQAAEALTLLDRARELGFDSDRIRFQRGQQLVFLGRLREAEPELEFSVALSPASGRSAVALARLRTQTRERNHLHQHAKGLLNVAKGTRDHAALEFALYKELEDIGRYDDAWQALERGNALMRARKRHDSDAQRRFIEQFIECCKPETLRPAKQSYAGPQPIFIIGLPRSGTTLLERMLGNHSLIESAGELGDFGRQLHWATDHRTTQDGIFLSCMPAIDYAEVGQRYLAQTQWRAQGKPFFIDKQSTNWMIAGLIHAALPRARILHMVRDPIDVCFSNYRTFFGDVFVYSYDLAAMAAHYRDYRRVLAHWHASMPGKILDVPYAELVRDPEAAMRKVLAFCGLEWEADCAEPGRNLAPVATLSAVQVRGSIHARGFEQWRPYAAQLKPLRDALANGVWAA